MTDEETVKTMVAALRSAGWTSPKSTKVNIEEFEGVEFDHTGTRPDNKLHGFTLKHWPTGIIVSVMHNKSTLQNKADAWKAMLEILPEGFFDE